ncbi:YcgN family cysteine cluster protein [Marinimicrobium sp. LS-A18]|uniref:YcgN family cysteine cluster protein n=1 Tax=Marinimicrobium sp. LS-A18 TaxID=1381596 RepID=UPI00046339DB|nr:YcgN family cysteine cluster protein [Marinimicrobium sp. LS-A18]
MAQQAFWERKSLGEMTAEEWESLCDGCGKCCLHKLEDEDTGEILYTDVACRYLDSATACCSDYPNRQRNVPDCTVLRPKDVSDFHWLPSTCAYRLLAEGIPLPDWHPLISGDPASVRRAGVSAAGRFVSETEVPEEDWEERAVLWV